MPEQDRPEGGAIRQWNYLAQFGEKLLANGYHIVPIRPGGKAPGFDGWEKSRATKDQLTEWLNNGHRLAGVGILTKNTPAIDIDVRDEELAEKLETYVREELGGKLKRIGKSPKRLFLFRTDKPFRKMRTTVRLDPQWTEKHQIEVLGDGQQCVAYHLHPETQKPYYWPDAEEGQDPLQVPASALPTITEAQIHGLLDYFEKLCDEMKWPVTKAARARQGDDQVESGNMLAEDTSPVDMEDDECRTRIMLVPNPEDYDTWVNMGMACHHQWDGEEIGLKMWHEWSETADNYDADALERRWEDFNIGGKKRAPITFRWVLKMANEAVENTASELSLKLRTLFIEAKDMKSWNKAAKTTSQSEITALVRSSLAGIAKASLDSITQSKTPLIDVKRVLAYKPDDMHEAPKWAENWVYDTSDDRFFATDRKISASKQGFDAMFDRYALTKKDILEGKTQAASNASTLALNQYRITTVNGRRYEPGEDPIFNNEEGKFANTYSEVGIPDSPERELPVDKRNVERVKKHIAHLLTNERDRRMFLDWISWVVQNPGKHVNYAVLLQGVEGDGKSFFGELMRAVMGSSNVQMLNAHIFESDFTDWTVGQCVSCVEEVRLIKAANKYETINRIKPMITNNIIEVHPKGKAIYNAKNTTSYLLFSNYKDALPIDDDGRRFLVLFSQWQRKVQLTAFKEENPRYYERLYAAVLESPGALREWLLNHEQHDDFNPMGDAPLTAARGFMIRQAKPEFIQILDDIITEDEWVCASADLVNVTDLPPAITSHGSEFPHSKSLSSMLQRAGWEELGKVRIDGARPTFYSKVPEMFRSLAADGTMHLDAEKVKKYIKKRRAKIETLYDVSDL